MILLMDRALLATYRKGFSFWGKVGQFSIRFAIALLIAVTVAHPVVLLLFSERIETAYNEGRIKTERNNLAKQCDLKNPQSDIRLFDEKITQFRNELKNSNQLFDPPICTDNTPLSTLADAPTIEKLNQELEVLKAKQIQANQDVALFIENAEKEKKGAAGPGFTGSCFGSGVRPRGNSRSFLLFCAGLLRCRLCDSLACIPGRSRLRSRVGHLPGRGLRGRSRPGVLRRGLKGWLCCFHRCRGLRPGDLDDGQSRQEQ
jgi:hypothetical protein